MKYLLAACLIFALNGCAWLNDFVYKIDVPQGNFLDERDLKKLEKGMTREQVRYVLGTPMVEPTFDDSKWYYVYHLRTGKGREYRKELIVHFDNEGLYSSLSGDFAKENSHQTQQALDAVVEKESEIFDTYDY